MWSIGTWHCERVCDRGCGQIVWQARFRVLGAGVVHQYCFRLMCETNKCAQSGTRVRILALLKISSVKAAATSTLTPPLDITTTNQGWCDRLVCSSTSDVSRITPHVATMQQRRVQRTSTQRRLGWHVCPFTCTCNTHTRYSPSLATRTPAIRRR